MKLPPYVTTRKDSKALWFRRRVPDPLIPSIGRAEFMESLRTRDVTEARLRAAVRNAEIEALFAQARLTLKQQAGTVLQLPPTEDEQDYIREAVRVQVLKEDDEARMSRPDRERTASSVRPSFSPRLEASLNFLAISTSSSITCAVSMLRF